MVMETGFINNTATVDCDQLDPENDSAEVTVEQNPSYNINKTVVDVAGRGPEANVTSAGDVISYLINVTNDGNIDLQTEFYKLTITDSLFPLTRPIQETLRILDVGEIWTLLEIIRSISLI